MPFEPSGEMERLRQRILSEGRHLGRGILKVDSFINHQVDADLMVECGRELARRLAHVEVTKVLTAEISGIAPAFCTALALGVPVVYARKQRPITMAGEIYLATAPSATKNGMVELMVSSEYLRTGDRVLIVDDFLASGETILALARLVAAAGARLVGIGVVIEKAFDQGRAALAGLGVPIEALARVTKLTNRRITLEGEETHKGGDGNDEATDGGNAGGDGSGAGGGPAV